MTSKASEYTKMALNGAGAAYGALLNGVLGYYWAAAAAPEEKVGGAVVIAFTLAGEYKLIRDTVRHYKAFKKA